MEDREAAKRVFVEAIELHKRGELDGAYRRYQDMLALWPENPDALHLMGQIKHRQGDSQAGLDLVERALAVHASPSYMATAATLMGDLNRTEQALAMFDRCLAAQPGNLVARHNRANLLRLMGRLEAAIEAYRGLLSEHPRLAELHFNLGIALQTAGEHEAALASIQAADRLAPGNGATLAALAMSLAAVGRAGAASDAQAKAEAAFQRQLKDQPGSGEALSGLGRIAAERGQTAKAIELLQRGLAVKPGDVEARNALASALERADRVDEARRQWSEVDKRIAHDGAKIRSAIACAHIYDDVAAIDTERARAKGALQALLAGAPRLDRPDLDVASTQFRWAYHGRNDLELQRLYGAVLEKACPSLIWQAPHCKKPLVTAGRRPRIGFLSAFFNAHTIMLLFGDLIARFGRQDGELFAIHAAPPTVETRDVLGSVEHHLVLRRDLARAREQIAALELDLLFYTDIGMEPFTQMLAHARLAPVQCVSWGHPVTTGIAAIDYFLSPDGGEPADAQEHYSEKLIRLRHLPTYYLMPPVGAAGARARAGVPADRPLYLCPQSVFKLHPDFDAVLAAILRADPRGTIGLLTANDGGMEAKVMARLRRVLADDIGRIVSLPRMQRGDFVALMKEADAVLDPFPFGGGNTTLEALSVGTPIVTKPDRFLRGRVTLACYRLMAVQELIAADTPDYARLAVRLGNEPEFRRAMGAKIAAGRSAIIENDAGRRELMDFFTAAIAAKAAGQDQIDWPRRS